MGGINNPPGPLNNLTASVGPSTTSDASQGYSVGSLWIDTLTQTVYQCLDATASAAVWGRQEVADDPLYVPGRLYGAYEGTLANATAVAAGSGTIYLYPFRIRQKATVTSLNIRIVTGAATSTVKMGLWRSSAGRPTSTPIYAQNTGQSTASSATTVPSDASPISVALTPGIYWFGSAFNDGGSGLPTPIGIAPTDGLMTLYLGRSTLASNTHIGGITAAFVFANNISALDLTGATFTDSLSSAGIPNMWYGV